MSIELREVASTFALVTLATLAISAAGRLPALGEHVPVLVGALFLWTAIHMAQRQPQGLARYGLRLGGLLDAPEQPPSGLLDSLRDLGAALVRAAPIAARELVAALVVAALVFPPFVLGFYGWHAPQRPFALQLPDALGSYLLSQLLVVALPEEALFRGYVQGRAGERFAHTTRVLGVPLSLPALLVQAILFALIHFAVDLNPMRLAVFFPALLFGWVREWRSGIGAAAALHALSNLLSDVLGRSWL
jgi:membrane protease YdiL (CAAX protease family)